MEEAVRRASSVVYQASYIKRRTSNVAYRASRIEHRVSSIVRHACRAFLQLVRLRRASFVRCVPCTYWYWMYDSAGLSFNSSRGVSSASPFFVSLW